MKSQLSKLLFGLLFLSSITFAAPPASPSNLTLSAVSGGVDISWVDNASDENGYKVFREGVLLTLLPANTQSYHDSSVRPQTTYTYTVKATTDTEASEEMLLDELENNTCPGERLSALDGIYHEENYTGYGEINNGSDMDYYHFKPSVAGTYTINMQTTSATSGLLVGSSCDDDDYLRSENKTNHSYTLHLQARQNISLRAWDFQGNHTVYTMQMQFVPDENNGTIPTKPSVFHNYENHLSDGDKGVITHPESVINDETVGTVKGTLVIDQGKARYNLDIPVPAGRAGMEPKISLEYNSHAGGGYLGKGWGIGGLSVITRCPSTKAIDGVVRGVMLDKEDQYCMNGQRLIQIGVNGDDIEYKTEINNYAKIIAHQPASSTYGPESWKVYTKSGLIYEYGVVNPDDSGEKNYSKIIADYSNVNTTKSRSISAGVNANQIVISWAVSTIKDRTSDGNAIEFYYKQEGANTERYISKIKYTGGEVAFNYNLTVDRYDTISGYLSGSKYTISELLGSIIIKDTQGHSLESYDLSYETSTLATTLTKIEHLVGTTALKPLDISWYEERYSTDNYTKRDDQRFDDIQDIMAIVDFNHDGSKKVALKQSAASSIETMADVNGDSFPDRVLFNFANDNSVHAIYGGINRDFNDTIIATNVSNGLTVVDDFAQFVDINNDNKSDLLLPTTDGNLYVAYSTGSTYEAPVWLMTIGSVSKSTPLYFVDLNRDGLPDIIHFNANNVEISYNNNGIFEALHISTDLGSSFTGGWGDLDVDGTSKYPRRFADINGDGYLDIVGFGEAGVWVSINAGNGFEPPYRANGNFGYSSGWREGAHKRLLADMNGDGYADIVGFDTSGTYIFYGTGKQAQNTGFVNSVEGASPAILDFGTDQGWGKDSYRGVVDIDNDGTLDIVGYKDHLLTSYVSQKRFLAVSHFNNHYDQSLEVFYASLMANGLFEKGPEYPGMITLTPAMQVVSYVATHDKDNLTVNETVDDYTYSGYRVSQERGTLGFASIKAIHKTSQEENTNLQTVSEYYQIFPFIGMVHKTYTGFNLSLLNPTTEGERISQSVTTMSYTHPYTNIFNPYMLQSTSTDYLSGIRNTTNTSIDTLGNVLNSSNTLRDNATAENFTTSTSNEYNDNTTTWLIGRLAKSTVTYKAPNQDDITKVSSFGYDATTGLLTSETIEPQQQKSITKSYAYDNYGNKISESITGYGLPSGMTTSYTFSTAYAHRFLTKVTNAKGYTQTNTYNASIGTLSSSTDANGNTMTYTYDALGKKIQEHSSKDNLNVYYAHTWDTIGVTDGLYSVVSWGDNKPFSRVIYDKYTREIHNSRYDMYGKMVRVVKSYNSDGTLAADSVPDYDGQAFKTILYTYDKYKRVTSITSPSPTGSGVSSKTFSYDGLSSSTTLEGRSTTNSKDARGKTTKVLDPDGNTLSYSYYADGKLKSTTDAHGNTISLAYDILGHKSSSNDPDMGLWSYDHDALGHPLKVVRPDKVTFMQYDALGRMHTQYVRGYTYHWVYNDNMAGLLGTLRYESKSKSDDDSLRYKKRYIYDDRARVTSTTETMYINEYAALENYTTQYSYYDNNKLKDLTYPNNLTIRHYYKNGYLEKIKDADTQKTLYQINQTNAFGKVTSALRAQNLQEVYGYNNMGLGTSFNVNADSGEKVQLAYTYDNRGNVATKYDKYIGATGLQENYTYDNLNRLTKTQLSISETSSLSYSYDTLGNLKKKGALTLSYKSNKPHQIDRVNGVTYQYDAMGNLLADDRHTFAYDPLDKVTSITQDGQTTTFDYNENGQRYLKITDNGAAFTHYSGKLYENYGDNYTTANRVEKNFIYFGGQLIAIKQRDVTIAPKAPTILYPYHDNLGNVIALLDEQFQIKERRSYTPFGTIRHIPYKEQLDPNKIPSLIERLKNTNRAYTGHESIEGTDIIHMNGRVYDTITARFTSADPFIQAPSNLQSYNRYSYVMNNPVNFTDPSGYWSVWESISNAKHWAQDHRSEVKQGLAIAVAVVTTALTGGGAAPAWAGFFGSTAAGVVASGALAGAISGAIMTGTLKGAAQGALWGGITAGVAFGVAEGVWALTGIDAHGASFFNGVNKASVMKAVAHGLSRTAISQLRYGTTKGAFLSGFVSSGFSVGAGAGYKGAFAMAIIGGTTSELGGGKFANGAMSSAFQYLFNDIAGDFSSQRSKKPMTTIFKNATKRSLQYGMSVAAIGTILESGVGTLAGGALGASYGFATGLIEGASYEALGITTMKEYYIDRTINSIEDSFHNIPAPQSVPDGYGNAMIP